MQAFCLSFWIPWENMATDALWCSPASPIPNCYSVGKLPIFRNFGETWQALCDICCNHSSISNITFEKIQSDTRDVKAFILSNCSPFLTHERENWATGAYRWGWWQHPWSNDNPGDFASFPAQLCNPHSRQFPTFSPADKSFFPQDTATDTGKVAGTPGSQVLCENFLCSLEYFLYSTNISPASSVFVSYLLN